MVVMVTIGAALLLGGLTLGWLLRGPARWCPKCGHGLVCVECQPYPTATGRASVKMRQPPTSTVDRPLMTRLAEQRAPKTNISAQRYRRRSI
jgi:hypothetical protein